MKCMNFRSYKSLLVATIAAAPLLAANLSHAATPVDLGAAGDFAILAKSGISTTGTTTVVGHVGISPAAATLITGFGLVLPAGGSFATSALVTGRVYAPGYAPPTPVYLSTAVANMETAYTDAAGRAADVTELGAGTLAGLTLAPGVYSWSSAVNITTNLTLAGGPSDVWIFKIAQTLTTAADVRIILSGGAQARHVFWQVAGATTLGARTVFKGVILDQTAITMNSGATLDGRALAQTAVTLIANTINSGAIAQPDSALLDDSFFIESNNNPDDLTCGVGVSGGVFMAYGDARGLGTDNELVTISYNAPQPTVTRRSHNAIAVRQSQYATLDVSFDGVSATNGPVAVERCSVGGAVNAQSLRGAAGAKCKTDDLFDVLSPAQVASIETAFADVPGVRIKIQTDPSNASLTIKCTGTASPD